MERVLVVNAGSSSLKLSVLGAGREPLAARALEAPGTRIDPEALAGALDARGPADVVGHRVVHGGSRFSAAVAVDDGVVAALTDLGDLAPLHQAKSLAALAAVGSALPGVPAYACFDTAFHATLPAAASTYALPAAWRERWDVRRFGFHGLSHAYASRRTAELLERPQEGLRVVVCHLGAGASLAAVRDGRSVDTTMGFTPLEGLVMATRSGSLDPGLVLWLLDHAGIAPDALGHALEHESGMLALAGTADMETVLERAAAGEERARLAFDVYVHRLRAGVPAMAAALGGLDALVFTGGVGERAAAVRVAAADGLGFLGVAVDPERNRRASGEDPEIGAGGAPVRTLVIAAREDLEIARQVRAALAAARPAVSAAAARPPLAGAALEQGPARGSAWAGARPAARVDAGRFDAVLFDLDGVLTSTGALHNACWKLTFDAFLVRWSERTGVPQAPFDPTGDYLTYVDGKRREDGVRDFLASRRISLPEGPADARPGDRSVHAVANAKQVLVAEALAHADVEAFPGSVTWVRALRDAGLRTAVVSSSENCAAVLDAAGLTGLFDAEVDGGTARDLGLAGKPAPDTFLEGARRVGADPRRAVVVEDALAGVAAGRAGGFGLVVGVARTASPDALRASGADVVVADLAEMLR